MNEETLSALLDGESTPAELDQLLDALDRSPPLRARFSRMCMARDSVQGLRLRDGHVDLAERVRTALEAEPAMAARRSRMPWPAVAGLALAAGLAAAVVIVVRPGRAPQAPAETTIAAAAPQAAAPVERDPGWGQLGAEDVRELNDYMVAHSRSRSQAGLGGTLGYARYAAYSAKYQSPQDDAR